MFPGCGIVGRYWDEGNVCRTVHPSVAVRITCSQAKAQLLSLLGTVWRWQRVIEETYTVHSQDYAWRIQRVALDYYSKG
jgi:hypothetical protein